MTVGSVRQEAGRYLCGEWPWDKQALRIAVWRGVRVLSDEVARVQAYN